MHSFYDPRFDALTTALPEEEARHAARSLRMKPGDSITLLNGQGGRFTAEITSVDKYEVLVRVTHSEHAEINQPVLKVFLSPLKFQDRFEWFLEKAGELGVAEITPIQCHRTERFHTKADRWERILVASLKQSGQAFLPQLHPVIAFEEAMSNDHSVLKLLAHCEAGEKLWPSQLPMVSEISVYIGPEGDFTKEEINFALEHQSKALGLGSAILRTETAAMAICAYLRLQNLR